MYDFIAIDFETATEEMNSACALGIACVDNWEIVEKKYYLIQPPRNEYSLSNTHIHGITAEDTANSPTFDVVWNEIKYLFDGDAIITAHNARFDMSVLKACFDTYSIPPVDFKYIDSIAVTNRQISDKNIEKTLEARAAYFNVPLENHHNALADAVACAQICIAAVRMTNRKSMHTYCSSFRSRTTHQFAELKPMQRFHRTFEKFNPASVVPSSSAPDESNPLYGKNVVFTGDFVSMSRRAASQKVADLGGTVKSSVSSKVDYLFVGIQDPSLVGENGHSSKEDKADNLIKRGHHIQVLKEDDFIRMISGN